MRRFFRDVRMQSSIPRQNIVESHARRLDVELRIESVPPIQISRPLQDANPASQQALFEFARDALPTARRPPEKDLPLDRLPSREASSYEFRSGEPLRKLTTGPRPMRGPTRSLNGGQYGALHRRAIGSRKRTNFCVEVHGKLPAHSVILLPRKPQSISQRGFTPGQIEFSRLEPSGSARNRAAQAEACRYPAVPRLRAWAGPPGRAASGPRYPVPPALKRRARRKDSCRRVA